jgi:transcriptional regulator with XRE-family HTH domain
MELNDFMKQAHLRAQVSKGCDITQSEMAKNIGVSHRTYTEYLRGTNKPVGMQALLNILSMLREDDAVDLIKIWKGSKTD